MIPSSVPRGRKVTPLSQSRSVTGSEKLSAANALAMNPAKVTPTCTVARKRPEFSVSRTNLLPRAPPSCPSRRITAGFREINATSEDAKNAFSKIRKNRNSNCRNNKLPSSKINPFVRVKPLRFGMNHA